MAQGQYTKIISMIRWIRTSQLSIKNSLSTEAQDLVKARADVVVAELLVEAPVYPPPPSQLPRGHLPRILNEMCFNLKDFWQ